MKNKSKILDAVHCGAELINKPAKAFSPTELELPDTPSVYHGTPLSLEDMERAVLAEAGKHR